MGPMGTIMMTLVNTIHYTSMDYVFFLLNLAIIAGYMTAVVTTVFPCKVMPVLYYLFSKRTRWATAGFFLVAALTRAELAWKVVANKDGGQCPDKVFPSSHISCYVDISNLSLGLHVLQAILVWLMLIFLAIDFVRKFTLDEEA
jgi:hypothetical protein